MAVKRLPVKPKQRQRQVMVPKKDSRTHSYPSTRYRDINHARGCSHVRRAITHHNISDKEMFLSILASGLSIVAALVSIGIVL